MRILPKIKNKSNTNISETNTQEIINKKNEQNFIDANKIGLYLNNIREISSDISHLNTFIDPNPDSYNYNQISIMYKEWELEIIVSENIEDNLDFILPFLNYEIIFHEDADNNINFSMTHKDIYTSSFYEVRNENTLVLHAGVYIKKAFDGANLIISNAQLKVTLNSPLKISN